MNSDPTRAELLALLAQSREYTLYLAELGVETIALSGKRTASLSTVPAVYLPEPTTTVRPPASSAEEDQSLSRAALFTPPPAILFAEPVTYHSKESMEDIWRDIGDCTRCGLCEGRTQVVNTFGNHKAR